MSNKGNGSSDGHWVTINGNHIFIEDSSSGGDGGKDSGGTVLKGRVEKTGSPPQDKTPKPQKTGGNSGGGSAEWEKRKPILATIAPIILEILKNIGIGMNSNMPHSYHDNSPETQKQKTFMDNVIKTSKLNLTQEEVNLQKMFDDIFNMPKGAERDALNQQFNQRLAEYSSTKSTLDRIDALNQNDMFDKIPAELDKSVYSGTNQSSNQVMNVPVNSNNDYQKALSDREIMNNIASVASKVPFVVPEASKLWLNSTHFLNDVNKAQDIILFKSSKDIIDKDLRNYVQEQIRKKLGQADSRGVVLTTNHPLAQEIAHSRIIKQFIYNNLSKLINGKVNYPTAFDSSFDLYTALNKADIIDAYIDKQGNFHAIIVDIYDFDKDADFFVLKSAYNIQKAGLLENYFEVIYIELSRTEVAQIINNPNNR